MAEERTFWECVRQALLMIVDAIERRWGFSPRTKECRDRARDHNAT